MRIDPFNILNAVVTATTLTVIGLILMPVFNGCPPPSPSRSSVSNVKQLATLSHIYAADYDGRFPKASQWTDALREYDEDGAYFDDPLVKPSKHGYAFFRPVSGANPDLIEEADEVPLYFQSFILAPNANSDLRSLPVKPRAGDKGDVYAHLDTSAKYRPREWALRRIVIQRAKP